MFEQEFENELQRQIAEKKALKDKTLAEKLGQGHDDVFVDRKARFKIEGDDENNTLMWSSLMKDCAFYYDLPTIKEEIKMKKTLQRKYDQLFEDNWRPSLHSRRDLVSWACG